jgi:RNA-directed DNA polymerase
MEADTFTPTTAGTPQGGTVSPLIALIALHGMDEALTQVHPKARVIADADDWLVLHPDRLVLNHCQQLLTTWRAGIGLTLNVTKTRIGHTLEGDQPGMDFLGCHLRQYRGGRHQSGKKSRSQHRLGYKTLITPAKANTKEHLAELGPVIRVGQNWPQAALLHKLNPIIRGWANYYRTWVCQATFGRLDYLTWVKLRAWARRRHPNTSAGWVSERYWPKRDARHRFATSAAHQSQAYLASHSDTPSLRHAKVAGHRSPYEGDWGYWSKRRGQYPTVSPRLATLIKRQGERCTYCGLFFHHADHLETDHSNGDRRDSRSANLQALHGHCHDAKTRQHGAYLPVSLRDKYQSTEERRDRKRSCAVLEQR